MESDAARWEFWIDVGGTFTDCLIKRPGDGPLRVEKCLSTGITRGVIGEVHSPNELGLRLPSDVVDDFWAGFAFRSHNRATGQWSETVVRSSSGNRLTLVDSLAVTPESTFELESGEGAPLFLVRKSLGLRLDEPIPTVDIKLGTTRGTNALLTRSGARTALIITRGFGDLLLIGDQSRPRLFDLDIRKPNPLYDRVVHVDERLDAAGGVLVPLDGEHAERELKRLRDDGVESLAVCLLHAYRNPVHEKALELIGEKIGFTEVTVSHEVSRRIKIVPRAETTVADAYLTPVLRTYLATLQNNLPGSTLRLMTSAGALTRPETFRGKDSVLSGPAGGVVGCGRIAAAHGFSKAIGFDMGGTSTDVCRIEDARSGNFERESEATKAGVRLVTPMLSIETVAAGGGSICAFDGVQLRVGPESAGADPGPACYGRGGPLTVTDLNVFLRRVPEDHFPLPLDRPAVEGRLEELINEVQAESGVHYTRVALAEGLLRIANDNMAAAIRNVSVAKGYNPADYTLVAFGGAGGQHACAIADELGIATILCHPFAGVLSAYGIGTADVHRIAEEPVLEEWSDILAARLSEQFPALDARARQLVAVEGIDIARIQPAVRLLEARYAGQDTSLSLPADDLFSIEERFHREHHHRYGYSQPHRSVEVVSISSEVKGVAGDLPNCSDESAKQDDLQSRDQEVVFNGKETPTAIIIRSDARPGRLLTGPAIVCEPTGTIVIAPGWVAEVLADGTLCAERREPRTDDESSDAIDPVRLEVFNNRFASIAEQMGAMLRNTAVSTNVRERLDYSCAVFSATGDLIANAPHVPVHLGAMGETVRAVINDVSEMHQGDVFVTNDPYRGGSHLPDITVVTPVFCEAGALRFFTASRAHHAEIGGIRPGSMPPFSKNLAEEGVLIRCRKLVESGRFLEEEVRDILAGDEFPSRSPDDNIADLAAQVAANNFGGNLLSALSRDEGLSATQAAMECVREAAAEKVRRALRNLPDGEHQFVDHLDDGSSIRVVIRIANDRAVVDFTGSGPVLITNLNANPAIVTAGVLYVFRCLIDEEIPLNAGVLDPIDIVIPESLLNPPAHADPMRCPAIVGGNVETSQRIVDTLLGALGVAAASQGTMNNLTFGNERFGYYETIGGGAGATARGRGADAVHTHMTNTRLTDPEVLEHRYPVRLIQFRVREDSGGNGRNRGGHGISREFEFLEAVSLSVLSERRGMFLPYGLAGGEPGTAGRNTLVRKDGSREDLGGKAAVEIAPGDRCLIETPGGGGFGDAE